MRRETTSAEAQMLERMAEVRRAFEPTPERRRQVAEGFLRGLARQLEVVRRDEAKRAAR